MKCLWESLAKEGWVSNVSQCTKRFKRQTFCPQELELIKRHYLGMKDKRETRVFGSLLKSSKKSLFLFHYRCVGPFQFVPRALCWRQIVFDQDIQRYLFAGPMLVKLGHVSVLSWRLLRGEQEEDAETFREVPKHFQLRARNWDLERDRPGETRVFLGLGMMGTRSSKKVWLEFLVKIMILRSVWSDVRWNADDDTMRGDNNPSHPWQVATWSVLGQNRHGEADKSNSLKRYTTYGSTALESCFPFASTKPGFV